LYISRLLKSWDPAELSWDEPAHRWTVVAQVLLRGDAQARRWLDARLSRDEIRAMIIASGGAGLSAEVLPRLRQLFAIDETAMPDPWPHVDEAWNEADCN
jgi:hypothetical protein